MRQVIIVSLGGHAYNIDEEGYQALRKYLGRASSGLKNNPDAAEILADLERGIGEKCVSALSASKNVVSAEDIDRILGEVGPVDGAAPEEPEAPPMPGTAKVLRRRIKGSSICGVCAGLADYFGLDVLIVRLAFVGLTLLSGAGLLLYLIMALVVPVDSTTGAESRLTPSKTAMIAVIALLFFAAGSLFIGGPGMHLGMGELMTMMFVAIAVFGGIAVVVVGVAMLMIRFLNSAPR